MEVILLERIEKLGQMGDVVKVKDGFARNFLLPQKKALRASENNLAYFEKERVTLEANNLKQKQEAEVVLEKLDNFNLIIIRQAGETGQLYGSVNTNDIKTTLDENGFIVEKNQITLDNKKRVINCQSGDEKKALIGNSKNSGTQAMFNFKTGKGKKNKFIGVVVK